MAGRPSRPRASACLTATAPASGARPLARTVDVLLEATVVGGFSRVGYLARRAVELWAPPPRVDGKIVVVTGASSGIGRATAIALGRLGAELWVLGRDEGRTEAVARAVRADGGRAEAALIDMAEWSTLDAFAERFGAVHDRLDMLVHSAGALLPHYSVSADGFELTVAAHVLGPYRLTWQLSSYLRRTGGSTIVTLSSGGMYTEGFDLDRLEMSRSGYDGVRAYARAKRAQVVLAHEWRRRWSRDGVASYSMHPGWVDTPGLASGLPSLHRLKPLLRTPEEGADTAIWLATGAARDWVAAATPASARTDDGFWHDRRRRGEYYLPWTRPSTGRTEQGRDLWDWCAARAGLGGDWP